MLEEVTGSMTLKEIMDLHEKLEEKLKNFGFDICCAKMDTLENACKKKGLNVEHVLEELNRIVREINDIERLTKDMESNFF